MEELPELITRTFILNSVPMVADMEACEEFLYDTIEKGSGDRE